jgi:hypothetical protein
VSTGHDDDNGMPAGLRYVEPSSFLVSSDCRVDYVLTVGNRLLDAHEREVIKAGAVFRHYGKMSADNMIGSETSRGYLSSWIDDRTWQIVHGWTYNN